MTVKFKQASKAADVVDLPTPRQSVSGGFLKAEFKGTGNSPHKQAELRSIKQHLSHKASICLAEKSLIEQDYSRKVVDKLLLTVRGLLESEFGSLRIYRYHQVFVVNHHCSESLIAGLLRVQYYCGEIPVPARRDVRGHSDMCGLVLSWGIGKTRADAELDRLDKVNHQ